MDWNEFVKENKVKRCCEVGSKFVVRHAHTAKALEYGVNKSKTLVGLVA